MKKLLSILTFLLLFAFTGYRHLPAQELTPEEIFANSQDAVVVIKSIDYDGKENSQGSGVIIKDRGIIVTNFHIFAGNEKLEVRHNDMTLEIDEITGIDIEKDILILKIQDKNYPLLKLGNPDEIKVGQKIYTIGSPMGLENTMSEGIISGLRNLGDNDQNFIQFTASLSPGSSGGAVLNTKGELIGISTMTYKNGQNLNFAISIKDIEGVTLGKYSDKKKLEALNFFFKGQNLQEEGKYSEAVENYDKYLKIFPDDAKGYNYKGIALMDKKDFESAVKDFNKALKLDPKYTAALSNRGECYYKMDDFENAAKDFSKVLKMDPDNIEMHYARGLIYSKEEDWDKAVKDFTKVIEVNPDYMEAYLNRGLAYYGKSDYELAIIDWKKCIKLEPGMTNTFNRLIDQADLLWQYNVK